MIDDWGISCKIALRWMPLNLTDDNSTLVQVMAWCRQATSHYLSQCWPRFMSPYSVTMPQWVNVHTWCCWHSTEFVPRSNSTMPKLTLHRASLPSARGHMAPGYLHPRPVWATALWHVSLSPYIYLVPASNLQFCFAPLRSCSFLHHYACVYPFGLCGGRFGCAVWR